MQKKLSCASKLLGQIPRQLQFLDIYFYSSWVTTVIQALPWVALVGRGTWPLALSAPPVGREGLHTWRVFLGQCFNTKLQSFFTWVREDRVSSCRSLVKAAGHSPETSEGLGRERLTLDLCVYVRGGSWENELTLGVARVQVSQAEESEFLELLVSVKLSADKPSWFSLLLVGRFK